MSKKQGSKKNIVDSLKRIVDSLKKQVVSLFDTLKSSRKVLALVVIVAVLSVAFTSLISVMLSTYSDHYLPSLAVIKTIEVEIYWDKQAQNKTDLINWGELQTGKSVETTVYMKSVSNFDVTVDLVLTDWSPPEISDYVSLTWDYDGAILEPQELIEVTLTMSAPSTNEFVDYLVKNEVTEFNVIIHFIATDN
jgi:hypothetical protein